MLQTLTNTALGFMGRIPVIREFIPAKYKNNLTNTKSNRVELETFHKDFSSPHITNIEDSRSQLLINNNQPGQTNGKVALLSILENANEEILNKRPDLKRDISSHIERSNPDPKARINFRDEVIINKSLGTLDALIKNYQKRFPLIQHTNAGNINPEEYVDLIQEYITKALKFILEVNNHIIYRTATIDPHIQDQDIAEAFSKAKKVSKKIAEVAFGALYTSFQQLPQISFEGSQGGTIHITPYISSRLKNGIKSLYLVSKFGAQSSEIFQIFKDQIQGSLPQNSAATDESIHNILSLIRTFQEATHGNIILNPHEITGGDIKIADLDKETKQQIIDSLIQFILKEYTVQHDDINNKEQVELIKFLQNTKKDLAYCLKKINDCEILTSQLITEMNKDTLWENLSLKDELTNIKALYSTTTSFTQDLLGKTNKETIMGLEHRGRSVIDELNSNPNNPRIALERIIHEISLLAVIDVLSDHRGRKRQNPVFESYDNFQTIPWLKPLYQARYKEYKSWIESEKVTRRPTRNLIRELARLGAELNDNSSQSNPMFSFFDFCQRYKIKDISDQMIPKLSDLTEGLNLPLALDVFSNLVSCVRPGEQEGLSNDDVKRIQDLTDFLREQAILRDKDGKSIIAPIEESLHKQKFDHLQAVIGNRGFLVLNTPIIIKFLLNSLGIEKHHTKTLTDESVEKKNASLASLLFYILLKHLPAKSDNIDSLLKRQEIFATLIDNFKSFSEKLPVLKSKFLRQSLGLNETLNGPDPLRGGAIPNICNDMERHLDEYPARAKLFQELEEKRKTLEEEYLQTHDSHIAKEISHIRNQQRVVKPISLGNILAVYDQLSECINRNPANVQQIQKMLKDLKQVNKPLLKDIRHYIENLLEVEPITLVNFIKTSANQELQTYTKKLLLTEASKLAQELIASNANHTNGNIQITDNDEVAIKKYSKILNLIKYIAFLVNHYGTNKVSINSAGIDESNIHLRQEIINRINSVSELMRRSILLLVDDNRINEEVFPGQLKAKRTLVELLEEFGIRSALDHKIEWTSFKKAQKRIEENSYGREKVTTLAI